MAFVTFEKKNHGVKNKDLDEQHQQIFDAVNALYDAAMKQKDKKTLTKLFENLVTSTVSHFVAEEKLMQKYEYPRYATHKKEHDDLTKQITDMLNNFIKGNGVVAQTHLYFIKDWLYKHIVQSDLLYVDHIFYHSLDTSQHRDQ